MAATKLTINTKMAAKLTMPSDLRLRGVVIIAPLSGFNLLGSGPAVGYKST
jgi:hypothetical protein